MSPEARTLLDQFLADPSARQHIAAALQDRIDGGLDDEGEIVAEFFAIGQQHLAANAVKMVQAVDAKTSAASAWIRERTAARAASSERDSSEPVSTSPSSTAELESEIRRLKALAGED